MPNPSTTSLKLDVEIKERVRRLASARRRSPHWVMREAWLAKLEAGKDAAPPKCRV